MNANDFDLNKWLKETRKVKRIPGPPGYSDIVMLDIRNRIECVDGFAMSVQASAYHYCSPKNDNGPYSSVEVGFPSRFEELLNEPENRNRPLETVYAYVPTETIEEIIAKHGGVKSE